VSDPVVRHAPGAPGIEPRWTSSAKSGVGTALTRESRVWFTLSHGILNEIYFPRVDQACTRDQEFIVTDGQGYFSEEKRHCTFEVQPLEPGVPAFSLVNTYLRPILRVVTLPISILTLGIFLLIINAFMILLVGAVSVQLHLGFTVHDFWAAFLGAIVVAIVGFILAVTLAPARFASRMF